MMWIDGGPEVPSVLQTAGMNDLPSFAYHPDPIATGSVVASDDPCETCGAARGAIYTGPVYAVDEVEAVCPWCIADGSVAAQFDATFTDVDPAPDGVPADVLDEIARRTPGFAGWQQERWLFHCNDGAAFLGRVGYDELQAQPGAIESLRSDGVDDELLRHLHPDGDATAYLFRCRHCHTNLAYADYT